MPVKYEYDSESNILNTRPYGLLSQQEVDDYFIEVMNNNEIKDRFIEVINFVNIDRFLFSSYEILEISGTYHAYKEKKKIVATILICEEIMHFGMAGMMQILHQVNYASDEVFIVRKQEEADKLVKDLKSRLKD